jgi:glycosyltransferase involved in cell wall biosynthesis
LLLLCIVRPQTPFIRKKLLDNGFPENRVGIWGRGVDLGLFNPSNASPSFRRRHNIEDDECVILWVGRLVKEKSPDIWAEVIRRLDREGLRFRALVVGSGSYEDSMKKLPRTEVLGWLSGKALAEVYASVDLFLFPSEVETFGNVTLEALASGVPCIASAVRTPMRSRARRGVYCRLLAPCVGLHESVLGPRF